MSLEEFKRNMEVFERRSIITLKCDMCGNTVSREGSIHDTKIAVAEQAYFDHSWRVRGGQMLCGYCTSGVEFAVSSRFAPPISANVIENEQSVEEQDRGRDGLSCKEIE